MTLRTIVCSQCKKTLFCRPKFLKKRIEKFGGLEKLKATYVCRNCMMPIYIQKKKEKLFTNFVRSLEIKEWLATTEAYKDVLDQIKREAHILNQKGIHIKQNRDNFHINIKNILKSNYISDFSINVIDNKVYSIRLTNIAFVGQMELII